MADDVISSVWVAGSGFQFSPTPNGDQFIQLSKAMYSTSGVSSPTNFPATLSRQDYSPDWVEVGIALNPPRPVINSQWTNNPPKIDGVKGLGEWSNLQISMNDANYPVEAYVYFLNDYSNLYVLVDAVGDTTDNPMDECLMWFGFQSHVAVEIHGPSNYMISSPFTVAIGYDGHKFYEFSIPFSYLGIGPGDSIEFCSPLSGKHFSMVYDGATGRDNVYPYWLVEDSIDTWGLLNTNGQAVGGEVFSPNRLAVLSPIWL